MQKHISAALMVLILVSTGGCSERVIYRDRELITDLPVGSGGFVGYTNTQARITVCGNCHVTQQNQWVSTAHASAFAAAAAVPGVQAEFCASCHAVTQRGNDETGTGGWLTTRAERHHDVQCESCHGPGEAHVRNPDGGTATLMRARVNAGVNMNGTCAECHNGAHHPYVAEWEISGHGRALASPAGNPACSGCHEGKAALLAFGVLSDYEEQGQAGHLAITCAVCHDPHRGTHEGQLRYSISVPDEEQNLCMRCHHKRGGPDFTAQNRGPHSPEGPMLLGEAGWWPPNMPIEPGTRIVGTHGSEANPRMCAGCHMQQLQVTDEISGTFQIATTGHMFEAIPCLDARGNPTRQDNCTIQQRTFRTCTGSGCHGSENSARSATILGRQRIDTWNAQLKSQLARVPAAEFNANDNRYTTAEGARFNSQLGDRYGSVAHNPFLMEALLIASIQQVQRDYGIAPAMAIDYAAELRRVVTTSQLKATD